MQKFSLNYLFTPVTTKVAIRSTKVTVIIHTKWHKESGKWVVNWLAIGVFRGLGQLCTGLNIEPINKWA